MGTRESTHPEHASPGGVLGLRCVGLTKKYGGVTVVDSVDLDLVPGQVLGLVGENGAGKSTTSAMIAGLVVPDAGRMEIDGTLYEPRNPADALNAGVALIHQEIRMVLDLTVAENIFLGRTPLRKGVIDRRLMEEKSAEALTALGSHVDPRRKIRGLSMAAQQEIEIARALTRDPQYVIFDEPSASLGESETERVLEQIQALKNRGVGIVYISHKLDEISAVADRVLCLRDGKPAGSWNSSEATREQIVTAMVGRDFTYGHSEPPQRGSEVVISVRALERQGVFEGINFDLHRGEILGVAGLIGAGRSEMARALVGADRATAGKILVHGKERRIRGPRDAMASKIAMIPEDRKSLGLNLDRNAIDNITLPWESRLTKMGIVLGRRLKRAALPLLEALDVRGRTERPVLRLSGGNQQKVLLAKWLVQTPDVLILDEPTRGVDVGAKMTIYESIRNLASRGVAVIVISSELEEVLGLSHRVLVMAAGKQIGILDRNEANPESVMKLALVGHSVNA